MNASDFLKDYIDNPEVIAGYLEAKAEYEGESVLRGLVKDMSELYRSILIGFKEIAEIENIPDLVSDIEKELSRINESIALDEDMLEPDDTVQADAVELNDRQGQEQEISKKGLQMASKVFIGILEGLKEIAESKNLTELAAKIEKELQAASGTNVGKIEERGLSTSGEPQAPAQSPITTEKPGTGGNSSEDRLPEIPGDWAAFAKKYFNEHQWLMRELAFGPENGDEEETPVSAEEVE